MIRVTEKIKGMFVVLALLFCASAATAQLPPQVPGMPQFPETAQFSIDLADIYAELFFDKNMASVICTLWLRCDGTNPVLLRLGGNIHQLKVSSSSFNQLAFDYEPPYFHLHNLPAGSHLVTFTYLAEHNGMTSDGIISPQVLKLDVDSWWYPRNVVDDPHQAILSIEAPPDYAISSNGKTLKSIANNLKWLWQFVLVDATPGGLTLD